MKKIVAIALVATMVVGCLVGCGKKKEVVVEAETEPVSEVVAEEPELKVGLICLHDENSTYDKNFLDAFNAACEEHGVEAVIKTNVPESNECYEAAADLVDRGCKVIFADSFGHENFLMQAAQEFPDVEFCHATGTMAHTAEIPNYHNAFASIYEGRFLAGVAAGMKLRKIIEDAEILEPKVGYVSAFQYAECISGFTSWFLGVRSVVPETTMEVISTGSWYDEALEKEAANKLISNGCVLISGHADSSGIPTACEEAGVPFTFYNGDISETYPETCIVSTKINWEPYFDYMISCVEAGEAIDVDWTGTLETGSVELTQVNEKVAVEGTQHEIDSYKEDIISGKVKVFDTSMFTVNGEELTSYMADVDTDPAYEGDTEAIKDGYFHESEFRSAPYFDVIIDGITVLTEE